MALHPEVILFLDSLVRAGYDSEAWPEQDREMAIQMAGKLETEADKIQNGLREDMNNKHEAYIILEELIEATKG